MKKSEAKVYKQQLLALRARLRGDVTPPDSNGFEKGRGRYRQRCGPMPIHMAEMGSENYDQEFSLSLLENDEETLEAIESALERSKTAPMANVKNATAKFPNSGSMRSRLPLCA